MPELVIGLKGKVKPCSIFGFAVGKKIEVSWELTNLGSDPIPEGRILRIGMNPPNGQFVFFSYPLSRIEPRETITIDKNEHGKPLSTNVLAEGYTLFSANCEGVEIQSPHGKKLDPKISFLSFHARSMEEIYEKWALIFAVIGLLGTFVTSVLQLLFDFGFLKPIF